MTEVPDHFPATEQKKRSPIERPPLTLDELQEHVGNVHTELGGSPDFVIGRKYWKEQIGRLRTDLITGEITPEEFDNLLGSTVAENEHYANLDPLTELLNRRAFTLRAEQILSHGAMTGQPTAFAIIDLDHFKTVNDTLGHDGGDAVLYHVAGVLKTTKRVRDEVGRWGGEEFVIALPGVTKEDAANLITRIGTALPGAVNEAVTEMGFNLQQPITLSVGLTDTTEGNSLPALIRSADHAVYAAKHLGRNRVIIPSGLRDGYTALTDLSTGERYQERMLELPDGKMQPRYDKIH